MPSYKTEQKWFREIRNNDWTRVWQKIATKRRSSIASIIDEYGWTPLFYAAYYCQSDVAEGLLRLKADPSTVSRDDPYNGGDLPTPNTKTSLAIHVAAKYGAADIVRILLPMSHELSKLNHRDTFGRYWRLDALDYYGQHFLHNAAEEGHLQVLKEFDAACRTCGATKVFRRIITQKSLADNPFSPSYTPYQLAAKNAHLDCIRFFLEHPQLQINPMSVDCLGLNALHWCAYKGRLDAVRYLLSEHKMSARIATSTGIINQSTLVGNTLTLSLSNRHYDVAEMLLADVYNPGHIYVKLKAHGDFIDQVFLNPMSRVLLPELAVVVTEFLGWTMQASRDLAATDGKSLQDHFEQMEM